MKGGVLMAIMRICEGRWRDEGEENFEIYVSPQKIYYLSLNPKPQIFWVFSFTTDPSSIFTLLYCGNFHGIFRKNPVSKKNIYIPKFIIYSPL